MFASILKCFSVFSRGIHWTSHTTHAISGSNYGLIKFAYARVHIVRAYVCALQNYILHNCVNFCGRFFRIGFRWRRRRQSLYRRRWGTTIRSSPPKRFKAQCYGWGLWVLVQPTRQSNIKMKYMVSAARLQCMAKLWESCVCFF